MESRSAEDVLAGVLRIAVGRGAKEPRLVPTLSICETREWRAKISEQGAFVPPADDWTPQDVSKFTDLSIETILDIVVAYDRTNVLGGREWLEENADPAQLYAAAGQMSEVAFPFATDTRMLLAALVVRSVVGSTPQKPTNGHLPTGDLTRDHLKRASTRRS